MLKVLWVLSMMGIFKISYSIGLEAVTIIINFEVFQIEFLGLGAGFGMAINCSPFHWTWGSKWCLIVKAICSISQGLYIYLVHSIKAKVNSYLGWFTKCFSCPIYMPKREVSIINLADAWQKLNECVNDLITRWRRRHRLKLSKKKKNLNTKYLTWMSII